MFPVRAIIRFDDTPYSSFLPHLFSITLQKCCCLKIDDSNQAMESFLNQWNQDVEKAECGNEDRDSGSEDRIERIWLML